jgi:hypothetical protein
MSKPFDGVVNVDIRDSTPDWERSCSRRPQRAHRTC